jgi:hypothetical protein
MLLTETASALRDAGFAIVSPAELVVTSSELTALRRTFDEGLALDVWLPPGHRYRKRAYQCFSFNCHDFCFTLVPNPPPYVQARSVNRLARGVARRFVLLPAQHPAEDTVLRLAATVTATMRDSGLICRHRQHHYLLDVHYIRITAPGQPAPEGRHRDGLIAGSVHLIQRVGVRGGTTRLYDSQGNDLSRVCLSDPLDSVIFDDVRVQHSTDAIEPVDVGASSYRDVLLFGVRSA